MIKASHNKWVHATAGLFFRYLVKLSFHDIVVQCPDYETNKPILYIGNHISWWDGFIPYYINAKYYGKKFYIMMLENELRTKQIFKYLGAYSINKNSKNMLKSLQYTLDLLSHHENFVVIFPQGKIYSQHSRHIIFEPGIPKLIHSSKTDFQVIMHVTLMDYFANAKPTLYVYMQMVDKNNIATHGSLQDLYNAFYNDILAKHTMNTA
ncbi:MAG: lysophospholipid acyltransferase family protein [Cytophagales bacterium]|nr:lysophospholipid acyltransferase family protein [Cytophagales bacterium]